MKRKYQIKTVDLYTLLEHKVDVSNTKWKARKLAERYRHFYSGTPVEVFIVKTDRKNRKVRIG